MVDRLQRRQEMPDESEWETLSALLDGELDDEEARRELALLGRDDARTARWSEYCLIGDVLRGCAGGCPELGSRIRGAVEREPTILAPMRRHGVQRPALWLAAAATVAAVTWTIWGALPEREPDLTADRQGAPVEQQVLPYLAAHQDYAQAIVSTAEIKLTPVALVSLEGER